MRHAFSVSAAVAVAVCLVVSGPAGVAMAHGPRGGLYITSGGFTFGTSSYGNTFFGVDNGSGLSFWIGSPSRMHFHPRHHLYGDHRYRRHSYGPPPWGGGVVIIDGDRHRPRYGLYDRPYGSHERYRDYRSRRVWVPGRSTPGGYVQGRWEMRPLHSGVTD